jgi:hypothetical protein
MAASSGSTQEFASLRSEFRRSRLPACDPLAETSREDLDVRLDPHGYTRAVVAHGQLVSTTSDLMVSETYRVADPFASHGSHLTLFARRKAVLCGQRFVELDRRRSRWPSTDTWKDGETAADATARRAPAAVRRKLRKASATAASRVQLDPPALREELGSTAR